MQDIRYTPKKHNHEAGTFAVIAMACALLLYALSGLFMEQPVIPQLCAFVIGAVGIYMIVRYCMTDYRYELREDNLLVIKKVGKTETMICNLTLKTSCGIFLLEDEAGQHSVFETVDKTYNYTVNFRHDQVYVYLFRDADFRCRILLEADEAFMAELKNRCGKGGPYEDE